MVGGNGVRCVRVVDGVVDCVVGVAGWGVLLCKRASVKCNAMCRCVRGAEDCEGLPSCCAPNSGVCVIAGCGCCLGLELALGLGLGLAYLFLHTCSVCPMSPQNLQIAAMWGQTDR